MNSDFLADAHTQEALLQNNFYYIFWQFICKFVECVVRRVVFGFFKP